MRILVLTQYFPPESAYLLADLVSGLSDAGHSVRVLTGFPNYPEGRLYPGFRQHWRRREEYGEAEVLRVPLFIDHSTSAVRRVLNYVSFGLSAATARRWSKAADVIYVYATQMTPAIGPWLWRLTGGPPYVLHVQDLWPDSITGSSLLAPSQGAAIERVLNPWLRSVYRRASAVIGIAPTMVRTLLGRGVVQHQSHLVFNWAEEGVTTNHRKNRRAETTRVLYAGNVGDMQNLGDAVLAAHRSADSGVELTIVGDGVALGDIGELVAKLDCTNVELIGRQPSQLMHSYYEASDFALVSLKDLPTFRGTIPSKFQAALANGLPVICTVQGDLRQLVEERRLGFTADAENVESLEKAFRAAAACTEDDLQALGVRTKTAYKEMFSRAAGIAAIESVLRTAAARH